MFGKFAEFGMKIISSEDNWGAFMGTYCPGIPYESAWDFSAECLIASVRMGAKPGYVNSNTITQLSWNGSYFDVEYADDPARYIYALNSDTQPHFFVEVIAVNREDLTEDMANWEYQP